MTERVRYRYGSKSNYTQLKEYDPFTLYFCIDTKELFKGEDLYSDGVRLVASYDNLPAPAAAANNKLYICEDTGAGYILATDSQAWKQVMAGVDNATIHKNANGQLTVKEIPIASVTGLDQRMTEIATACENDIDELRSKKVTMTLLATLWENGQQTVAVTGVTEDTNGMASLPTAATEETIQAASKAKLALSGQANDLLTFTVAGDTPSIDIPIEVILLG